MLDPERVKLSAANIGFLKQKGIAVDFENIRKALQTDDGGCVNVRREAETPVNELHVMGGQRLGLEGNMNIQEYARQARRMNGYPLRSFSANAPAIILPPKYGGFPQYVNNESERENYVSRFTEPMSAPLQQNTMLLGPQGFSVSSHSASDPFKPLGFELNLHKSRDAINYNDIALRQRKYLLAASRNAAANKDNSGKNPPKVATDDGVFVGANGQVMSQVQETASGAYMQDTVFDQQQERIQSYQRFETPASNNGRYLDNDNTGALFRNAEEEINMDALDNNASTMIRTPIAVGNTELIQSDIYAPMMTPALLTGGQAGSWLNVLNSAQTPTHPVSAGSWLEVLNRAQTPTSPVSAGSWLNVLNSAQTPKHPVSAGSWLEVLDRTQTPTHSISSRRSKIPRLPYSFSESPINMDALNYTPTVTFKRDEKRKSMSGGSRMIRMNTPDYGFSKRNKRRESLGGTPSKYVDMVANIYDEVMLRSAAKKRGSKKNSAMRSAMMTIPGAPIDIQKEINRNKRRHRRIKGDTAYDLANKSIYGIVNPYTA